ncbi:MAG TPA: ATP-binding cassette domain-containing protein [Candidatus Thermoplasmatota archaeon]|nr:ATP-binding cassette domain-containing protein [Candidatus Thermoplasmatota archaeon]
MVRLALEGVGKVYGAHRVLGGLDLALDGGDLLVLRGASGAGKTTLLQIAGLLEPPSEGRVILDGEDVAALDDDARARVRLARIGHVFQTHNMIPSLTLLDNVLLPMRLARRADAGRARALLADVGLAGKTASYPDEVSIGERQRAAFARALANEPDVLLADEPTASLDDANATLVTDLLEAAQARGCAVLVASHDGRVKGADIPLISGGSAPRHP